MVAGKTPRRKHSRSRTGCLTCRKRRVKCDEKRPICTRCEKGSRECSYPPPPVLKKRGEGKVSPAKQSDPEYGSEESIEEFDDFGEDEASSSSAIVKFSSALSPHSSSDSNDPFETLHLDDQMLIDSLTPPSSSFPMEPLFSPPPIAFSTVFGSTPSTYSESLQLNSPSSTWLTRSHCIPPELSLRPSRGPSRGHHRKGAELEAWITRLLDHHRREITDAHYFRWFDYPKFYTEILFALCDKETETENPLRIAVAAFSALNRSIKQDQSWRPLAFIFYGSAVQRLHTFLHKSGMDLGECQIAVATALELASFDRYFGDAAKSFRHITGAAKILQQVTDPMQFNSTVIGRALLEWYMSVEDYCCFLGAYKLLLPRIWRDENIRERERLAGDYSHISTKDRKARILDDVWAQFLAKVPALSDILYGITELKKKDGEARTEAAQQLELELRLWEEDVDHFFALPRVLEVLEPAEFPPAYLTRHVACCPQPPFVPLYMQYPPAGMFRMCNSSLKCYIRALMLPSILEALGSQIEQIDEEASGFAEESCRVFAGLEETLGDGDPDALLPLFASLVLATSTCPKNCHNWLRYKLGHFEKQGHIQMDPVKKSLSKLWDMPEIASGSPPPLHTESPHELEPKVRELELREDEEVYAEITRARGLSKGEL